MRAAVLRELGGPDKLHVEDVAPPSPSGDEALVRLKAAALNRRDMFLTYGQYPGIGLPSILGSDGAGTIAQLPEDYGGELTVGDDVVILPSLDWGPESRSQSSRFTTLGMPRDGTFAELVTIPIGNVFPMPAHLSYPEAAALPLAALTAYRALISRGELSEGETVLITGAGGGVAGVAIQLATALGARVFATSRRKDNLDLATRLGAVGGVTTGDTSWSADLKKQAGAIDLVLDTIGGDQFPLLLRLLRVGGRLVTIGASAGPVPELVMPYVFLKQLDIRGTTMGNAQEFGRVLDVVSEHGIHPQIAARFPLADAAEALRLMENGAPPGKIILDI